ncbi:hypothetical protein LTR95_014074 [Oleoguttula sp. CCFEE 5521]
MNPSNKTCQVRGSDKSLNVFPQDAATADGYSETCADCSKKKCSGCGSEKSHSEFARRALSKDGYDAKCKDCKKMARKNVSESHPPLPPGSVKVCQGECGTMKPVEEFGKTPDSKDRYKPKCKACSTAPPGSVKTCQGPCATEKPVGHFQKNYNAKDGYEPKCKACTKDAKKGETTGTCTTAPPGSVKTCQGPCNTEKPVEEFDKHHTSKDGYEAKCKACRKALRGAQERSKLNTLFGDLGTTGVGAADANDEDAQDFQYSTSAVLAELQRIYANLYRGPTRVDKRYASDNNYWVLNRDEILSRYIDGHFPRVPTNGLIRALQRDEAARGLLPVPRPLHSPYHYMSREVLNKVARSRGWASFARALATTDDGDGDVAMPDVDAAQVAHVDVDDIWAKSSAPMISFLLQHDHSSEDGFWKTMDGASQQALASMLVDDLTLSLSLEPSTRKAHQRFKSGSEADTPSQLRQVQIGEVVGITGTDTALEALYPLLHDGGVVPQATSTRGLLCGVYALERSLRYMQRRLHNANLNFWLTDQGPPRIPYGDMMCLLFSEWDPTRQYNVGDTATPTAAYDAYIRQQYGSLLSTEADEILFNDTYTELTRVMDLDAAQLQAILTLLYDNGNKRDMPVHYQLSVVRSGVALGGDEYNHFEAIDDSGGHGYHDVLSWGMRVDADLHRAPGRVGNEDLSEEPAHDKELRIAHNVRVAQKQADRQAHTGCIPCREQNRQCTGEVWQPPCPECQATELSDGGDAPNCTWDNHLRPAQWITSSVTPEQREMMLERWNTPVNPDDIVAGFFAVDPLPAARHFLVMACARTSSARDPVTMATIAADQKVTLHHDDNMLNAGPNANHQVVRFPVGQCPTDENGGYLYMRKARFTIARHGTRAVPTTAGNLNNPAVIRLVALFHEVFDDQRPVPANHPYEIHMLLNGFAGLSVGISAWGSLVPWEGFYAWLSDQDLQNNTALAERIYVVVLAEPHVVDGVAAHSLEFPNRTARWPRYRGKHLHKRRLVDLITRNEDLRANALGLAPLPQRWPAADEHDLDILLEAMMNEARYRSAQLDAFTVPRVQDVAARKYNRNLPMR